MLSKAGLVAALLATVSITSTEALETSYKTRPSWSRIPRSPLELGHEYSEHVLAKRQLPADVTK
jgi:hypothetical protein